MCYNLSSYNNNDNSNNSNSRNSNNNNNNNNDGDDNDNNNNNNNNNKTTYIAPYIHKAHRCITIKNTKTRSAGKGGARGGGRPSNVLQDHFSNSSNSGVKIAGGG